MIKKIAITIDLEDWFQVENLRSLFPLETWRTELVRFQEPLNKLLNLFDKYQIKATFFVLGWIAERYPEIIKELYERGHEIASHGMTHRLNSQLECNEIKAELVQSKELLERIINDEVIGYRAPSFTISDSVIKCLQEVGYKYDSSYFPFKLHKKYGRISLETVKKAKSKGFREFSIPMGSLMKMNIPYAGGAYFRLLPLWFIKEMILGTTSVNIIIMYFHPWEFDPNQPKIKKIRLTNKIRHYYGIKYCGRKFEKLLNYFRKKGFVLKTLGNYFNEGHNEFS